MTRPAPTTVRLSASHVLTPRAPNTYACPAIYDWVTSHKWEGETGGDTLAVVTAASSFPRAQPVSSLNDDVDTAPLADKNKIKVSTAFGFFEVSSVVPVVVPLYHLKTLLIVIRWKLYIKRTRINSTRFLSILMFLDSGQPSFLKPNPSSWPRGSRARDSKLTSPAKMRNPLLRERSTSTGRRRISRGKLSWIMI